MNPDLYASPQASFEPVTQCSQCATFFSCAADVYTHTCPPANRRAQHTCPDCGKGFAKLAQLKTHERLHSGERPYGCVFCTMTFKKNHHAKRHVKLVHKKEPPATLRVASMNGWPDAHLKRADAYAPQCPLCNSEVSSEDDLRNHIQVYHADIQRVGSNKVRAEPIEEHPTLIEVSDTLSDPGVTEWFIPQTDFRLEQTNGQCVCMMCHKTFIDGQSLAQHRMHCTTPQARFECQVCRRVFDKQHLLTNHLRSHSSERYNCSYCTSQFSDKGAARTHMRRNHKQDMFRETRGVTEQPSEPVQIANVLQWVKGAQDEQRLHEEPTPPPRLTMTPIVGLRCFTCPKCSREFNRKDNCQTHMKKCLAEAYFLTDEEPDFPFLSTESQQKDVRVV